MTNGRDKGREPPITPIMANDYGQLAKRISAYTSNCLVSALVLVAGLGFARQVLHWWAADEDETPAVPSLSQSSAGLGDPARLHVLQFGDQAWSLRRQSIVGDHAAAAAALRDCCRRVIPSIAMPKDKPEAAESRFLRQLATTKPVDQQPGKWQLFELAEALPMVVGTKVGGNDMPPEMNTTPVGSNLVEPTHRVVIWGLAMPAGPNAWTLCTFQEEPPADRTERQWQGVPIPPECTKTLSMRVAGGGALITFGGACGVTQCKAFYQQWLQAHHAAPVVDWRQVDGTWHARYAVDESDFTASVDIRFAVDRSGRFSGLLLTTPEVRDER